MTTPPPNQPPIQPPPPPRELREAKAQPPAAPAGTSPWPLRIAAIATASVVAILLLAMLMNWVGSGNPQAAGTTAGLAGTATESPTETGPQTPTAAPDLAVTPEPAPPGARIPISMNVAFESGITFQAPVMPAGWTQRTNSYRPEEVVYSDPSGDLDFSVWQFDLVSTRQSDLSMTTAELGRAQQACAYMGSTPNAGEEQPSVWLTGADGTQLELLVRKFDDCVGGSTVFIERLMPQSGTRIAIQLWYSKGVDPAEIEALANQVTFTRP